MEKKKTGRLKPVSTKNWWLIGLVVILAIVINIFSGGKILSVVGVFMRSVSTITPTPTEIIDLFPPQDSSISKEAYIDLAMDDLVNKLKINKEEIKVVKIESKNWANTSLGCPERDKMYADVITPGYLIVLSAKGKSYTYHAGLERIVICQGS